MGFFYRNSLIRFFIFFFVFINLIFMNLSFVWSQDDSDFFGDEKKSDSRFSITSFEMDGRRVKSIVIKENSTQKSIKVDSGDFLQKRFFGDYRVTGAGKNKVIINNGIETINLEYKPLKEPDKAPVKEAVPVKAAVIKEFKPWDPQFIKDYWQGLSRDEKIKFSCVTGFIILVVFILFFILFKKLFLKKTAPDLNIQEEEDFSNDYEPDQAELDTITERLKVMETHDKFNNRIVDILLNRGLIDTKDLEAALEQEKNTAKKAEIILVESKKVKAADVFSARAERYGMEYIDKNLVRDNEKDFINKNALSVMPYELAKELSVFPYKINRKRKILYCLYSFKPTESLSDDIRRETGFYSKFAIAESDLISEYISKYKNYFILKESFKLEDMMDKNQKKAREQKKAKKELKFTMAGIFVKLILSLCLVAFGIYFYISTSNDTLIKKRFDEYLTELKKENSRKVFDYLDPDSARVFDIYTLKKKCGITSKSTLSSYSIFELKFSEDKKRATLKWVGIFDKSGSKSRAEFIHTWGKSANKWRFMPLEQIEE